MHGKMARRSRVAMAFLLVAASCGESESTRAPMQVGGEDFATAQATMDTIVAKVKANDPSVLWRAMPESWQGELTGLVRLAATKVDRELYDASFEVARLGLRVLREKRDLILAQRDVAMMAGFFVQGGVEALEKNWDAVLAPLDTILSSELRTHEGFAKLDAERFLHTTGGTLMKQFKAFAESLGGKMTKNFEWDRLQVVSESGDRATMRVVSSSESSSRAKKKSLEMTRVEGRWVPEEMARDFASEIAKAREKLAAFQGSKHAKGVVAQLSQVRAVLQQLLDTNTPEEFQDVLSTLSKRRARARPGR